MINTSNNQLEANNLKVIKDQLSYESLMNKKFSEYANRVNDTAIKNLCNEACQVHKNNFNTLRSYLESHQ